MPFTLAHPAAVVPLRRFKYLQPVALVVGSMTPDVPYYLPGRFEYEPETHTLVGSLTVDVPLGLLLIACGLLLRGPLTALMSGRARWLYLRAAERFTARPVNWLLAIPSLLIGSWTHIAWDSFTHPRGWVVQRVDALSAPITLFGWYTGEVCHVLQYLSSVLGLAVLVVWYLRAAASAPVTATSGDNTGKTRLLLVLVIVAAIEIGAIQALKFHAHAPTFY
jgi:hypothetical protein